MAHANRKHSSSDSSTGRASAEPLIPKVSLPTAEENRPFILMAKKGLALSLIAGKLFTNTFNRYGTEKTLQSLLNKGQIPVGKPPAWVDGIAWSNLAASIYGTAMSSSANLFKIANFRWRDGANQYWASLASPKTAATVVISIAAIPTYASYKAALLGVRTFAEKIGVRHADALPWRAAGIYGGVCSATAMMVFQNKAALRNFDDFLYYIKHREQYSIDFSKLRRPIVIGVLNALLHGGLCFFRLYHTTDSPRSSSENMAVSSNAMALATTGLISNVIFSLCIGMGANIRNALNTPEEKSYSVRYQLMQPCVAATAQLGLAVVLEWGVTNIFNLLLSSLLSGEGMFEAINAWEGGSLAGSLAPFWGVITAVIALLVIPGWITSINFNGGKIRNETKRCIGHCFSDYVIASKQEMPLQIISPADDSAQIEGDIEAPTPAFALMNPNSNSGAGKSPNSTNEEEKRCEIKEAL